MKVYSITGQKVAILANGFRERGAHVLGWDGRDDEGRLVASGVYVYRLRVGVMAEQTRRMVLLR